MTAQQTPKDWKTYDQFAFGIDTNRLPASQALKGKSFAVAFDDGRRLDLAFTDGDTLAWREGSLAGAEAADVVEVAENTYFIDIAFAALPTEAETLILNLATRRVLSIRSIVRKPEESVGEPQVAQIFRVGVIDDGQPATGLVPAETRDLIGLRAHFTYSPNHVYEHTYLSSQRYCWQCLKGVQRGHGDVDLTTTIKFAEDQYIFTFREFKIPVASVFFYNFETLRSTGKFLGITGDGKLANNKAGAHISKASMTLYRPGEAPV
jgi:hypothetical protein